jgi:hypothetical protein
VQLLCLAHVLNQFLYCGGMYFGSPCILVGVGWLLAARVCVLCTKDNTISAVKTCLQGR